MSTLFTLSHEQQIYLGNLAVQSIVHKLKVQQAPRVTTPLNPEEKDFLQSNLGSFVTLQKKGRLRGCIGSIVGQEPLEQNVQRMAVAAAFEDPRFPPLTHEEWVDIELEISVLGPLSPCPKVEDIEIGRHGLILALGHHRGVFLPKVPVEQGWDLQAYLQNLCAKAQLPSHAWQDPKAQLFWYECFAFKVE